LEPPPDHGGSPARGPEPLSVPIGAHVSIRGRIFEAIPRAEAIGCECLQIFVGSPRQWRPVHYPGDDLAEFRRRRTAAHLDPLVAHTAYLINLAAPDPVLHHRSVASLIYSLQGMDALRGFAAITHIGSFGGAPWPEARARVAEALRAALAATERVMILLEGSAGGTIGGTFEEIGEILHAAGGSPRLGVCLDTAHLFASGWDLRMPAGVAAMIDAFDRTIGLRRLCVLHVNDSKAALGSHLDRHENIGSGQIGRAGFRAALAHPALRDLPAIIETPGFDRAGPDRRNIMTLKRIRTGIRRDAGGHAAGSAPQRRPGR
jgi:deoxyribonuclease IV